MAQKPPIPAEWSRRRTRHDPPDVEDAVTAAQGLTDQIEFQVEIAAQLIGLPADEIRPAVLKAAAQPRSLGAASPSSGPTASRTVVIERRNPRAPMMGMGRRRPA